MDSFRTLCLLKFRKESIGAEFNTSLHLSLLQSSSSRVVVGGWDEGDKAVLPLKKRKGISFDSAIITTSSNTVKEKMKSKTNKKCLSQNGRVHLEKLEEGMEETDHANNNSGGSAKKGKRGSVIMEGSRCSRVNGRGWRCCQQTLVGYSLCEHHLGKGRLRSMTSVRNRGVGAALRGNHHQQQIGARDDNQIAPPPLALRENQEISNDMIWDRVDDDNDEDDNEEKKKKKPLVKKRMKIGGVKARSISSLLGQTDVDNRAVGAANVDGGKDKYGCEDEYCHV